MLKLSCRVSYRELSQRHGFRAAGRSTEVDGLRDDGFEPRGIRQLTPEAWPTIHEAPQLVRSCWALFTISMNSSFCVTSNVFMSTST